MPWAHLDIAGTAWDVQRPYFGKGATGFGVRLLVRLARRTVGSVAEWTSTSPTTTGCSATPCASSPSSEVAPVAEELDRTKAFPYEIVRRLGELDLMGIPFPEEYGGGGGDTLAYALAVEELTRVDSSVAITLCAHTSLGHAADLPVRLRGAEARVAAAAVRRRASSARSG